MWAPICDLGKEKEIKSMKIKRKVQKTLPQLIEWAWDNGIDSRTFIDPEGGDITFDEYGEVVDVHSINHHDTFTVEVEEVVDEDTKFRHIVFIDDCGLSASWGNSSINDIKYGKDKEYHAYIDGEFKLIWRDGKLVD